MKSMVEPAAAAAEEADKEKKRRRRQNRRTKQGIAGVQGRFVILGFRVKYFVWLCEGRL